MNRLLLCLLLVASIATAAERRPTAAPEFAPGWVLVRLERPLEPRASDGTFSRTTPYPELNSLIAEREISMIEHALPVSTRAPRWPASLARHGLDRLYRFHVPQGTRIRELIEELSSLPGVEWAGPDYITRPGAILPGDPLFPDQWGLNQPSGHDVDAPEAWQIATGRDVIVAVIDTGVDMSHEDLAANLCGGCGLSDGPCWDFVEDDPWPEDYPGGAYSGHGTNASSIIAGVTNNGLGVAGICWDCCVIPLRVWDQHGNFGTASMVADAVVWAVDHGARVINYSGGGYDFTPTTVSGVAYAADAGVIHVSITGNEEIETLRYPGRFAETIAAGATDPWDQRAAFSNYGPEIDVVAPGVDILSADLDDAYLYWSGTSYSAPFVSGLAAVMRSIHPAVGKEEARHLIRSGAEDQVSDPPDPDDTPGFDDYYGWGRINMERSLAATESSVSLRVEGRDSTRVFLEVPNPLADSYDFIRGNLSGLSEGPSGVSLGNVLCLENDSPDPDTGGGAEDDGIPGSGEGYFYLARFNASPGAGSYGGSSRNRDRVALDWAWLAEGDQSGAAFGFAVDSAGDVNGDGYDDVVIGAYLNDGDQPDDGATLVFLGSPTGLASNAAWWVEGSQPNAWLGTSVAGAGDVNGDGYDDIIVGSSRYDGVSGTNEGLAEVYLGSAAGLESTPDWTVEGGQQGARLGFRVSTAGDVNNDGYDDVIVAVRLYDNGQTDEGRAYVYHGSAGGLPDAPTWVFETNQANAQVTAVATAGDVNDDGYDDVIVGSRKFDNGETDEGQVYLFLGSLSGLAAEPVQTLEIDVADAQFGFSVSAAGDVDGDGHGDVIVGAATYTNGEEAEGAVFLYAGSPDGLSASPIWGHEGGQAGANLGQSVDAAGDVNGDGFADVVVGGGSYDDHRTDEGGAWLFYGSGAGLATAPVWSSFGRETSANHGWAAAAAGDVNGDGLDDIVIGAYGYDNDQSDEGRAYVIHGPAVTSDCSPMVPEP